MVNSKLSTAILAGKLKSRKVMPAKAQPTPTPAPELSALQVIMARLERLEAENKALKARPTPKAQAEPTKPVQTGWSLEGTDVSTKGYPLVVIGRIMSDGTVARGFKIGSTKVKAFLELTGNAKCRADLVAWVKGAGESGDE